jgi:hypothetical protein
MARNSIEVYNKANVLRVETIINDPTQFRVLRVKNGHRVWCPMRKGVANLSRYYQDRAQNWPAWRYEVGPIGIRFECRTSDR